MLVSLDCGNSQAKLAYHNESGAVTNVITLSYEIDITQELANLLQNSELIYCTVTQSPDLVKWLKQNAPNKRINATWNFPFKIEYATPSTLGADRLAAMAGARAQFANSALLIIDIGTCITYDFINETNTYIGGAISPGIDLRLRAMNQFTNQLPYKALPTDYQVDIIGNSTQNCLWSSALYGTLFEIDSYIKTLTPSGEFNVVLTGGSAKYLANKLECNTFVAPNLNHIGLHKIYELNAERFKH
ncbi:MAG: type III pantothenate kinase [Bacteroidetes bacterium]|nr:type III pantothenate kinase [Bacteroidota bacterium]